MAGQAVHLTGCPEDRSVKTAQGTASCGGHRRGDVVIIHSIPTTSVGIHVNALPSEGGGRIALPLHQMTAKSLFLGMHWGRLARAMMASPIVSFEQPVSSDLPTARYALADQPIQPPPPSGGGGPQ